METLQLVIAVGGAVITILLGAVAFFLVRVFEKVEQTFFTVTELNSRFSVLENDLSDTKRMRREFDVLKTEFELFKKHNGIDFFDTADREN